MPKLYKYHMVYYAETAKKVSQILIVSQILAVSQVSAVLQFWYYIRSFDFWQQHRSKYEKSVTNRSCD